MDLFSGLERRQFVRIEQDIQAKLRLVSADDPSQINHDWNECTIKNISCGGVCVCIHDSGKEVRRTIFSKANVFEFDISLPSDKKVVAKGNVLYVKALGKIVWNNYRKNIVELGVKFSEISDESTEAISQYIVQKYVDGYGKKLNKFGKKS